jgi:hypothetical protein
VNPLTIGPVHMYSKTAGVEKKVRLLLFFCVDEYPFLLSLIGFICYKLMWKYDCWVFFCGITFSNHNKIVM